LRVRVRVRVRTAQGVAPVPLPGFLVLETNFRLYSYTDSPLWVESHAESAAQGQ